MGDPDDAVAHSREVIRKGSKSFAAASALFDRPARESAWALYAWCRHCDDVIDGQSLGGELGQDVGGSMPQRLDELFRLTDAALTGDGEVPPEFEQLRRVGRAHDLPLRRAHELLQGFAMDVEGRRYLTLEDTLAYAYHVAGVVGVMMAQAMGVRDRPTLERACDLGLAFQLTNIARDVMEDARAGRVYLPADWLAEAGVAPEAVAVLAPENRDAVTRVAIRLLDIADGYYVSARAGVARLPLRRAWAIAAARDIYREIGRIVRRRGAHAWDSRAASSTPRKLWLLARGGAVALATRLPLRPPPRDGLWTLPP